MRTQTPAVIAHRGDSSQALENSLEAIRRALLLSVDMIELDVRMSRDGVLFLMHDRSTSRTADQGISLENSTSEQIGSIRLKNGEPVPTLGDVLTLVSGKCRLNVEIKSEGAGLMIARYLLSSGYQGPVLLTSFHAEEIDAARQVMPDIPAALLFDVFRPRSIEIYRNFGYSLVCLRKRTVNEKLISACHEQDLKVYAWTIDDEHEMKKFISWGVDGIFSNKPGLLKEAIHKLQITNYK